MSPRFTDDSRERVRDAVDFVAVVGARTELRKAGVRRYVGLCPFHEERTPSFGIDPVEKLYYCFGCQAGGDVFRFVQETEGLSFGEALEVLADRHNVTLERAEEDPRAAERRGRRDRLLALLERTAAFYVRMLWESDEAAAAREYLAGRGLEEGVLREFRVGYSPAAWDRVLVASGKAGYSVDELFGSGLAQRGRSGPIDRFRGRLMFPLADPQGRVRGFGARALADGDQPKYLNSAEAPGLFSKGEMLFGTHLARAGAARSGTAVLVEGYTDVIALHQAGLRNAVGIMGTALTEQQVRELAKLAPRALLCLDADAAGQEAMARSAAAVRSLEGGAKLRAAPLELLVAPLPAGSDPAELVQREGADSVQRVLDAAVPFKRFQVERLLAQLDRGADRDKVLAELAEVIGPLPLNSVLRGELTRLVAGRFAMQEALVETALATARRGATTNGAPRDGAARRALDGREATEHLFLALCIAHPEAGRERLATLDADALLSSPLARRAAAHLRDHLDAPAAALTGDDEPLSRLVAELVLRAREAESSDASELSRAALHLDLARLDRDIAAARIEGDPLEDLARERQKVLGELRSFVT